MCNVGAIFFKFIMRYKYLNNNLVASFKVIHNII